MHDITCCEDTGNRAHATVIRDQQSSFVSFESFRRQDQLVLRSLGNSEDRGIGFDMVQFFLVSDDFVVFVEYRNFEDRSFRLDLFDRLTEFELSASSLA